MTKHVLYYTIKMKNGKYREYEKTFPYETTSIHDILNYVDNNPKIVSAYFRTIKDGLYVKGSKQVIKELFSKQLQWFAVIWDNTLQAESHIVCRNEAHARSWQGKKGFIRVESREVII